jgi:hypothetical protein
MNGPRVTKRLKCSKLPLGACSTAQHIALVIELTYHRHDEHDEESVAHRNQGHRQRRQDLLRRLQPPKQPHHAQGAQDADGEVEGAEHDQGHSNDDCVEDRPSVCDKVTNRLREKVEEELDCEDDSEDGVQQLQQLFGGCWSPVWAIKIFLPHLHLGCRNTEVLFEKKSGDCYG